MKKPGWCCDPKDDIADFVGISRPGLYKMVDRMILKGLIEADAPTSFLRATVNFIDSHDAKPSKQSLQRGVNKVDTDCKQSLHDDVNKVSPLKEECNVESDECDGSVISSTADAAAHAEPSQRKKSKTKKMAAPAAPKSDSEPKYNWTREAAKAFDEVASEQCQANGIDYSPFNWRVCSERNFGHLKNLRVEAILPDLIAKRKQEGIGTQISEADILKSLRRIFTEAWLFYHKKAQFVGGKMKYTPERIYIDYNEIKSQIIQRRANATNQHNTSTGYAPTAFNQGVGNIDKALGF